MNLQSFIAAGVLALAIDSSHAADEASRAAPLTRAQVRQSVLKAQASGQLRFGEEPNYPYTPPRTTGKSVKRKVKAIAPSSVRP